MNAWDGAAVITLIIGAVFCIGFMSQCTSENNTARMAAEKRGTCVCNQ